MTGIEHFDKNKLKETQPAQKNTLPSLKTIQEEKACTVLDDVV